MQIRTAAKQDARLLSRLCVHVQRLHAEAYPDLFKPPEQDDFALSFFEMVLDDPAIYIYIAEDPQPVGYLMCQVVNTTGNPFMFARSFLQIGHISVEPDHQGKGAGKMVMERADQLAAEHAFSMVSLTSWSFNQDAHAFFQARGYKTFNLQMWKK